MEKYYVIEDKEKQASVATRPILLMWKLSLEHQEFDGMHPRSKLL